MERDTSSYVISWTGSFFSNEHLSKNSKKWRESFPNHMGALYWAYLPFGCRYTRIMSVWSIKTKHWLIRPQNSLPVLNVLVIKSSGRGSRYQVFSSKTFDEFKPLKFSVHVLNHWYLYILKSHKESMCVKSILRPVIR